MADPAIGSERAFDKAIYSPIQSAATNPADRAGSVDASDTAARGELTALIRLGTARQDAGSLGEAEDHFRRALELADRLFQSDDPNLILLLNDLSRLYLRQSAFSLAEPLLLRLLELKRSKGEDHPEVATVLASLASVRQALGMHESSEQLWRRVLDIRERTLAPNHFATANALEHLGEACAARGKTHEALSAYQRALTIREKTLGNEHPSLRVARERIADLQLQASEDMLDASLDISSPPERYRLLSAGDPPPVKLTFSPPVAPPPQLKVTAQTTRTAPPQTEKRTPAREKRASLVIPRGVTAATATRDDDQSNEVVETMVVAEPSVEPTVAGESAAPDLTAATAGYRDALESVREAIEQGSADAETFTERSSVIFSGLLAFAAKREVLIASGVIVVLGLLGTAAATGSRGWSNVGQPSETAASFAPPGNVTPTAAANPIPDPVSAVSSSTRESNAKTAKPRVSEERSSSKKTPEKKSEPIQRVSIPTLSTAVLSGLDAVAARAATVTGSTSETINVQPAPTSFAPRRPTFDDDHGNAPQRARLIGELPTPHVPPQVADVEGEVRVRFNVDSLGRPVLESFSVVNSPNPLLTAAVRKVVPGMRFEPARTAGPDAKAIGDVVQIGFQFSRRE